MCNTNKYVRVSGSKELTISWCTKNNATPDWIYKTQTTVGLTIGQCLLWGNVVALIVHLCALVTVFVITFGNQRKRVQLPYYRTELKLHSGYNADTMEFDASALVPAYVTTSDEVLYIDLALLIASFFLLSALAHGLILLSLTCSNVYYCWIGRCMQPARFVEYTFSASVLIVPIVYFVGARSVEVICFSFVLTAITMPFGWVCEQLSRPLKDGYNVRPLQWRQRSPWLRLFPWFLGWIPFLAVWVCVFANYDYTCRRAVDGRGPPDWVIWAIVVEFALFSCFAGVQFCQQVCDAGCKYYWVGEMCYIALSVTSKLFLGTIIVVNVILATNESTHTILSEYDITSLQD